MTEGLRSRILPACGAALLLLSTLATVSGRAANETAGAHHARGVEHHLRRSLDEASREYRRALELDPPRELSAEEWQIVRRFAPRLYTTPTEFFPLKDFAAVLHPETRQIAYHLFWEDDIDFPEDNDPCDHEVVWVEFGADKKTLAKFWTYFHGRILEGSAAAIEDARRHSGRPRVNVQWGKHGSLPVGWEKMPIVATQGDAEKQYYPVEQQITIERYQEGTFRKLTTEGRRLGDHPLALRLGWPRKFTGTWKDFNNFSRLVEPLDLLEKKRMALVSRWNSAVIDQHFLPYNFRPKTEWPQEARI